MRRREPGIQAALPAARLGGARRGGNLARRSAPWRRESSARAKAAPEDIAAIGITNQRETVVLWDRATGQPDSSRHRLAVPPHRRRCATASAPEGFDKMLREKTGLVTDAYFSGTKIAWLLENVPGARERAERGELACGTIDTWLIWNLTRGRTHVDRRLQRFADTALQHEISRLGRGDPRTTSTFPRSLLPEVKSSSEVLGETDLFGGSHSHRRRRRATSKRRSSATSASSAARRRTLTARAASC